MKFLHPISVLLLALSVTSCLFAMKSDALVQGKHKTIFIDAGPIAQDGVQIYNLSSAKKTGSNALAMNALPFSDTPVWISGISFSEQPPVGDNHTWGSNHGNSVINSHKGIRGNSTQIDYVRVDTLKGIRYFDLLGLLLLAILEEYKDATSLILNVSLKSSYDSLPFLKVFNWQRSFLNSEAEEDSLIVMGAGNGKQNFSEHAVYAKSRCDEIPELSCEMLTNKELSNFLYVGVFHDQEFQSEKYSSIPGKNELFQDTFVVVEESYLRKTTGQFGTSHAAAMLSAYIGLAKDKRPEMHLKEIRKILLETVKTDFIGFNPEDHGSGLFIPNVFLEEIEKHLLKSSEIVL